MELAKKLREKDCNKKEWKDYVTEAAEKLKQSGEIKNSKF